MSKSNIIQLLGDNLQQMLGDLVYNNMMSKIKKQGIFQALFNLNKTVQHWLQKLVGMYFVTEK